MDLDRLSEILLINIFACGRSFTSDFSCKKITNPKYSLSVMQNGSDFQHLILRVHALLTQTIVLGLIRTKCGRMQCFTSGINCGLEASWGDFHRCGVLGRPLLVQQLGMLTIKLWVEVTSIFLDERRILLDCSSWVQYHVISTLKYTTYI